MIGFSLFFVILRHNLTKPMKYYEVKFTISPLSNDASDLLAALAGEAGFETFEESEEGLTGYVQQQLFDHDTLDALLQAFPLPDVAISYAVNEAEDRDWNEQWEQEGFEPIIIKGKRNNDEGAGNECTHDEGTGNECTLIIHDGRHLPEQQSANSPILSIEIDARLAFGTGTHETTRMICATLISMNLQGKRILDCGSGTGILGIAAMKLGGSKCVAYDIDEWSVDNTRHNAVINQVELTPLHGDASILNEVEGTFDVILANINRNILLQDLPTFRQKLTPGGCIILSGFYTPDIEQLAAKAHELQLHVESQEEDNGWACILLK